MASFWEDVLIRIKAQDNTKETFTGLKGKFAALKIGVGAAVTAMGSQMLQFSETCITSATQAEQGWNAYNAALERAGLTTSSQLSEMKTQLLSLANSLGRSTGDVRQAATDFMNYGASAEEAMKGAAAVSAIAAAKNTDYASSENIIMSALKGRGTQLKSLGLDIANYKDATTGAINTTKLFADITEKYGSNQTKYAKSALADQTRMTNSINAFKTAVGQALVPILEAVTPLITAFAKAISANPLIAGFVALVVSLGGILSLLVGPLTAISGIMELLGIEITVSLGPIGLLIIAIAAIGTALVIAYKKVAWFRNGVNALWRTLKAVGQQIYNFFSGIAGWMSKIGIGSFVGTIKTQSGAKGGGAGGKDAGTTYTGQQQILNRSGLLNSGFGNRQVRAGTLTTGNPSYTQNSNTQTHNVVLQEGALQVDARNLTTHEAKQVLIGALEGITSKRGTTGGKTQNG